MNLDDYRLDEFNMKLINKISGYKKYPYDKNKMGELVAECRCDYYGYHATARLETCDEFDGYVAIVKYVCHGVQYIQKTLFLSINSTLEQFQKNYGVNWDATQEKIYSAIHNTYDTYKKKLKKNK